MFIFKEMTDKYKKRCIKGTYKETHKRDMYTFYKDIFTDFYLQTTPNENQNRPSGHMTWRSYIHSIFVCQDSLIYLPCDYWNNCDPIMVPQLVPLILIIVPTISHSPDNWSH